MSGIAYQNWKFTRLAPITVLWDRFCDRHHYRNKESQVKNFLNAATRLLLAAANCRAINVLRKQAELAKPFHVEFRSNAGGWN